MDIKGKKLLILGGTSATLDLVKNAKSMGAYTIVTDFLEGGVAKEIADETATISTTDFDGLEAFIKERCIDGVFCGPSEFNIRNLIKLCEKTGLRCYTDMQTWDRCANKDEFKQFCIENGVDCPERYYVDESSTDEELSRIDFPVIVKPVDGNSSRGISVCYNQNELKDAYSFALESSTCKRVIVEKYIENGGELFGARYIIKDGEAYPYLLIDTYIADPNDKKGIISNFTYTPSKYSDYYMKNMDKNVRKMLKNMGLKNGTAFFQALPYKGKIYFHEMGYRLSGGMLFKFTEPLMGINDMKMMLRFALGGDMCTNDELKKIDVHCNNKVGAQLMIPLVPGKISKIEGLEKIKKQKGLYDFIQYYYEGDSIAESAVGTLSQHFGRFTFILNNIDEVLEAVKKINSTLIIYNGEEKMNSKVFDANRFYLPD